MTSDKIEQESSSERTLKVECNNGTSGADAESHKRFESNEEKKLIKSDSTSDKGTTGSNAAEETASKNRRITSADEKRRKKKVLDPKFLKHYPNIPGKRRTIF